MTALKVGQRVIPIASTHPDERNSIESIMRYNEKGYLLICEITKTTVFCHKNGKRRAWGNYNAWSWHRFKPEDLVPAHKNQVWFTKYKAKRGW